MLSRFSHILSLYDPVDQAPLSMGFSRQEYRSGLPSPSPGDLPDPAIKPTSLRSPALAGGVFTTVTTREAPSALIVTYYTHFTDEEICPIC